MDFKAIEGYVPYFKQLLKTPSDITPEWKDIIGRDDLRGKLLKSTWLRKDDFNMLFLFGAPGTGKSTLIAGLATFYNMTLLKVSYEDLKTNHPLDARDRLCAAFKVAKEAEPCILHFDGVEIMLQDRDKFVNEVAWMLTSTFKRELDYIKSKVEKYREGCTGLLFAASTSNPERMERNILSKFMHRIHVPVLSRDEREEVIKAIDEFLPLTLEYKESLLNKTKGFSYGDMQDLAEQIRRAQQYREISLDDIVFFAELSIPMLEAANQSELVKICNDFGPKPQNPELVVIPTKNNKCSVV